MAPAMFEIAPSSDRNPFADPAQRSDLSGMDEHSFTTPESMVTDPVTGVDGRTVVHMIHPASMGRQPHAEKNPMVEKVTVIEEPIVDQPAPTTIDIQGDQQMASETHVADMSSEVTVIAAPATTTVAPTELPLSGATKLRKMIFETQQLIVCPGVYDGLSARTALEQGFQALYMTGAGTTASRLGQPDLAIAQLYEMRENADMIAGLDPYGPPLIADMDTGYGGPLLVARTVEQYIRSGVAGAHLEDQVLMKRCGHLGGKKVVPREEYLQRIRAAHQARVRLRSDFVLIARTDALQAMGYDECIARLKAARDIGADVGLLEGFKSKEQAAQAVKDLAPWPLLYNSVENGASPTISVDEARAMGFRIMIFSFATLAPAYTAIRDALIRLKTIGGVGTPKEITPVRLFEVCGLKNSMAIDVEAGGSAFDQDVGKV